MGAAHSTSRSGLSVPELAKLMGLRSSAVYDAIARGRGPQLQPVEVGPWAKYQPVKSRSRYVTFDSALGWLHDRLGNPRFTERQRERHRNAIHQVRLARAYAFIQSRPYPVRVVRTRAERYAEDRRRRDAERQGHGLPLANFAGGNP
jgi:hypothetical protein